MAQGTKARTEIWASQTLTAGAGDTTSASVDLTSGLGAALYIRLLNGATGPTVPAQVQIQVSSDDTEFRDLGGPLVGLDTANGDVSWGGIEIHPAIMYLRLVAGSNTAQNVTVEAEITELTDVV